MQVILYEIQCIHLTLLVNLEILKLDVNFIEVDYLTDLVFLL